MTPRPSHSAVAPNHNRSGDGSQSRGCKFRERRLGLTSAALARRELELVQTFFFATFEKAYTLEFSSSARKRPSRSPKNGFQKAYTLEFDAQKSKKVWEGGRDPEQILSLHGGVSRPDP